MDNLRNLVLIMSKENPVLVALQQCQRERLQIEPADSFGALWIQAVPLDAVLSEFVTAPAGGPSLRLLQGRVLLFSL